MSSIGEHEPLLPFLIEIAESPESRGTILAGGLGLRLKRQMLRVQASSTVFEDIPEVRATSDIDLFLNMEMWIEPNRGSAFRNLLDRSGYVPIQPNWQFQKAQRELDQSPIILDLMAREPVPEENVKVDPPRVGVRKSTGLHGHFTPEAFAIDDLPISVQIGPADTTILIAHPYAYLNLKACAAKDWAEELAGGLVGKQADDNAVSLRLKHVVDVYLVVGMMTERELEEAEKLAQAYRGHPKSREIRDSVAKNFGSKDALGCAAIRGYGQGQFADHFEENYSVFSEVLKRALGVET